MKRIILVGLVVFLCLPIAVYAASIGGVETQGQGKFSIGLDQEFVFDRDIKKKTLDFEEDVTDGGTTTEFSGQISLKPEIDKMYRTMVKASYGLLENLDVFVKLGAASGEAKYSYSGLLDWEDDLGDSGQATMSGSGKYKLENAFAYGFGMKGRYELGDEWFIGGDVQYIRHKNDYKASVSAVYTNVAGGDPLSEDYSWKGEVAIQEWHVAPYIAKKLGNFIPYFGVRYSDLRATEKDDEGAKYKYKADDNFGVFLGTDCKIGENLSLNLEGRFIDETAMSLGATYKF